MERIGISAGSPVHWSAREETTTVMIGHDAEIWHIAVRIPTTTIDTILVDLATENW